MYKDSLVSGSGMMGEGNLEDLISLAKAAVKKTKTQLETVMSRHLAIADPRNGPEFIKEVWNYITLVSFNLNTATQYLVRCVGFDTVSSLLGSEGEKSVDVIYVFCTWVCEVLTIYWVFCGNSSQQIWASYPRDGYMC